MSTTKIEAWAVTWESKRGSDKLEPNYWVTHTEEDADISMANMDARGGYFFLKKIKLVEERLLVEAREEAEKWRDEEGEHWGDRVEIKLPWEQKDGEGE